MFGGPDLNGGDAAAGVGVCLGTEVDEIDVELTENLAMLPAASVSGLYFGGKCSEYFSVGKITTDQLESYAERKKMGLKETERWLGPSLSYEV